MSATPNMQLTLPEVLVTSGPQYATQINTALDVVDAHDHSAGKGVRITPSGLNINSDLTFANNQATNVKAVALLSQASVATLSAIYNKNGNLFFRDGSGNEIQLTAAGALNVSSVGAITGLTSPASASFVLLNDSFVFQNNATTYAKLEIGDVKIYPRGVSVGTAQAVTLIADSTTSAYNLNLPVSAPSDYQLMRMKTSSASEFVSLLGTTNQVTVAHNAGNTTLALPQNIHTGASPTFAGLTLTGALGGTSATLSGALQAASATITGNVSLTGSLGSTISASNYALSLNGLTTNTIGATIGSEVFVQGDLAIQTVLKTNTIAVRTGSLVTFSNGITMPFLPISAGAISGTTLTASSSVASPVLNIASGVTIADAFGITTTQLIVPQITNGTIGVEIDGRSTATNYPLAKIGYTADVSAVANVAANTSYQSIISHSVPAGVWKITAIMQFEFTATNSFGGFGSGSIERVEAALSTSATSVTDQPRYMSINTRSLHANGEIITATVSTRHQANTATTYYLIGKTQFDPGSGGNFGRFTSAGCRLFIERVG